MPQFVNLHLLGHASAKAGVLIIERLRGWVHVNIGGHGPDHLVDRSETCVRLVQSVTGLRDQRSGDFRPRRVAYVSGTLGTLIGADLLNLRWLPELGAGVASIGRAGTFDGVFLSGIMAVVLVGVS